MGAANQGEVRVSEELMEEHEHLSQIVRVQVVKLAPMHIVDWEEAQEADAALAACSKWLHLRKDRPLPKHDAFRKECLGVEAETEQGKMFFCIRNSLVLDKGLMYMSTTPKGKTEGVLTFVVPVGHHDAGHQGQQRTLALAQERFWWPMMADDCRTIVRGCPHCRVFVVPAKLLSDRGANFTSALVQELCAAFSIQKCQTTAYYAQCNGQVERFHQMLFCMIGKLAHDKKAQWEQHLPELLQAYNTTWSMVTGYSPHYLMFGRHPHLPIDYYFLTVSMFECSHHVPAYVMEVRRKFKEAYAEAHLQMNCEAKKQKQYYDKTTSTTQLVPGDVVLMKNGAYQGK